MYVLIHFVPPGVRLSWQRTNILITQHFLKNTTVQALFPYTAALSAAKKAGAGLDGFCKK